MQVFAQKIAMQAALFGSMSLGSYLVKKIYKQQNHPFIEDTVHLANYSELCYAINGISLMGSDLLLKTFIDEIEKLLTLIHSNANHNLPWELGRRSKKIVEISNLMKIEAIRSHDNIRITYAIDYEKDYLPLLQKQLDDILHNVLLERH